MFERGRFRAAKLLDASVLVTVGNTSVIVAFIGALFLYSETLSVSKLIGGILIIGALLLVSLGRRSKNLSTKGILFGMLNSTLLGLGWMLDKRGAQLFNASTYNILIWTVPLVIIAFPGVKPAVLKSEMKSASWRIFLLAGLNVVGYLLQLMALEVAEATRVIPIVQTSTLFTVLLGIVLLGEKENIGKKVIAASMAIVGAYFLI